MLSFCKQFVPQKTEFANVTCRIPWTQLADAMVLDFLLDIDDRYANCFVTLEGQLLLLDNDSGSLDPSRKYPGGSRPLIPHWVKLRDSIEEFEGIENEKRKPSAGAGQVLQHNCLFHKKTVQRLRSLTNRAADEPRQSPDVYSFLPHLGFSNEEAEERAIGGVGGLLKELVESDRVFKITYHPQAHTGFIELNRRVARLLACLNVCVAVFGESVLI